MKVYRKIRQGSDEWFAARAGRPTASKFGKIITPKGKLSAQSEEYLDYLIGASFMPEREDFGGTRWTDRGNELEPEAREAFQNLIGREVHEVGFVTRDDNVVGCSPDGLLKDANGEWEEGLEIKCKSPGVHAGIFRSGKLPDDVKVQVHGCLAVTGLPRWHFFSFLPGVNPFHLVVERDEFTDKVSAALDEFLIRYAEVRKQVIPKLQLPKSP